MEPLDAISEPRRREILALLGELGECPVGELAELIDITRPAVSQHLRVLRETGIVSERKEGRRRFYSINPDGLAEARAAIEVFLVNELDELETQARAKRSSTQSPTRPDPATAAPKNNKSKHS